MASVDSSERYLAAVASAGFSAAGMRGFGVSGEVTETWGASSFPPNSWYRSSGVLPVARGAMLSPLSFRAADGAGTTSVAPSGSFDSLDSFFAANILAPAPPARGLKATAALAALRHLFVVDSLVNNFPAIGPSPGLKDDSGDFSGLVCSEDVGRCEVDNGSGVAEGSGGDVAGTSPLTGPGFTLSGLGAGLSLLLSVGGGVGAGDANDPGIGIPFSGGADGGLGASLGVVGLDISRCEGFVCNGRGMFSISSFDFGGEAGIGGFSRGGRFRSGSNCSRLWFGRAKASWDGLVFK